MTATCPNCRARHHGLPVDGDEDGRYAKLDTSPCQDDACTKRLCYLCVIECGGCFLGFCREHVTDYAGRFLCGECMALEASSAPEPEPIYTEAA